MAISSFVLDYLLSLKPVLDRSADRSLLELGEAQTYQIDLADYADKIASATGMSRDIIATDIAQCRAGPAQQAPYREARAIYGWVFSCRRYRAADQSARDPADRIDLNFPFDLGETFDVVINNGTSEHVFNQANVFAMMHAHARPGGLLIHYTTCLGWIDHGFYNVQPNFFFDLAKYNGYEVLSCCLVNDAVMFPLRLGEYTPESLADDPRLADALLCTCLRRRSSAGFRFPQQYPYQAGSEVLGDRDIHPVPQAEPGRLRRLLKCLIGPG